MAGTQQEATVSIVPSTFTEFRWVYNVSKDSVGKKFSEIMNRSEAIRSVQQAQGNPKLLALQGKNEAGLWVRL